ncbi:MAG TPA: ThuA domain-containing protein [Stellaceae bacterium]|nr:ThuA domain-containing protein [Stellaceae bacterium]
MTIDYRATRNILVTTKGHAYDRERFVDMFDAIAAARPDLCWTHVEQPAINVFLKPETACDYAAIVFYDIPGLEIIGPQPPNARLHEPSGQWKIDFERLLEAGQPLIFLHHAICGWPAYPRYAEVIGGRYLFVPQEIDGVVHPDSGYVHDAPHFVYPVAEHPVTRGLEEGFELVGEPYLYEVFEDTVLPLMRCRYDFTVNGFYSTHLALQGKMHSREGWTPSPGSDLVVWARREKNSPIVYIQPGHDALSFDHPAFRRLLGNAIDWITGAEAREWARGAGAKGSGAG